MVQKVKFPLRYKILLVLTITPLVVLGVYLTLAISVFKNDKMAYVFDSSSSSAQALAAQIQAELQSVLAQAQPILQEYIEKSHFGNLGQISIQTKSPLKWIAVFRINGNQVENNSTEVLEKQSGGFENEKANIPNLVKFLENTELNGRAVTRASSRLLLLGEKVNQGSLNSIFVFGIESNSIFESFETPQSTENYWIQNSGEIILAPPTQSNHTLLEILGSDLLARMTKQKNSTGTLQGASPNRGNVLISYKPVGVAQTLIVTLVSESEALQGVQVLLRKSVIFALLILAISVLVSLFLSRSLTGTLRQLFSATQQIAQGNFEIKVGIKSNDEIQGLADSFQRMAQEVSRLMQQTAENARMANELATARTVQETLFPVANIQLQNLNISGHYEPASECGGDWWYYNQIGKKVYLWIGDATGHGAPAALITSAAKSAATLIENLEVEPSQILFLLNQSIFEVSKGRIQMTFYVACFDPETSAFTYACASHEPPFLIPRKNESLSKHDLVPLNEVNSPRLGERKDAEFLQATVTISPGDRIIFYTDGVIDTQNPGGKPWGEREFLKAVLASQRDQPDTSEMVANILRRLHYHRGGALLKDDITFFLVENRG